MSITEPVPAETVEALVARGRAARRNGDRIAALAAFEAAVANNPRHAGLRAEAAAELRALGRLEEAEMACRTGLALDPSHAACLAELGHIARQRGDRKAALAAYQVAMSAHPANVNLKIHAAAISRELGQPEVSLAPCQQALALDPNHIGALTELGHAERRRGDRAAALAVWQRAMAADPNHLGLKAQAASELHELGRYEEAEALCREGLAKDPRHVGCLAELARLARHHGDHTTALSNFQSAAAAQPMHVGLKAQVARELRELGRLDEATATCREGLSIEPNHLGCLAELAHIARRRGDHLEAIAVFQTAITLHPAHVGLKLQAASELRELGKLDEAIKLCESALAVEPNHPGALAELGHIARRRGDRQAAFTAFEAAAAAAPDRAQLKLEAVADLRELERHQEAEALLRDVVEAAPQHSTAWFGLGQISRARGDRAVALSSFMEALKGHLKGVGPSLDLTAALCELGHIAPAELLFGQRLKEQPGDTAALLSLGRIKQEQFRFDEAQELFQRAAETAPSEPVCWLSLARLARRRGEHALALKNLEAARFANPSHVGTKLETVGALREMGRFDEAAQIIAAVLTANPYDFGATMQLGHLQRSQGERQSALETFTAAHRLAPQNPQALVEMALEHRALGEPAQSESLLRQALTLLPHHQAALEQLAEHHFLAEDFDEALAVSRHTIALYPHKHTPYLRACRAALELGQNEEAGKLLDQADQLAGPYPEIRAMRASNHMRNRDWDAARETIMAAGPERKVHQCLWTISAKVAIAIGDYEGAEAELPSSTMTRADASRLELWRGQIEEGRWQLYKAAAHYRAALALAPDDGGAHFDLARTSLKLLDLQTCRHHLSRQVELMTSSLQLRGQSDNFSQTHIGQLIDEFALDQQQLEALRVVRALPATEQVDRLKEMVRLDPDHTPTAIMLLIAMREAGLLVRDCEPAQERGFQAIPQLIVQYWDDPEPPIEIVTLMESWRKNHPGFQYICLNDQSARKFLKEHHPKTVLRAYERAREPAQRADLLRLAYLSVHGGFYTDADDRCLAPLSIYVPADATFVAFQEDYGTLGNNLLGVVPDHPIIRLALELGSEALNRGDKDFLWLSTGPGLLTRAFAQVISLPPDAPKSIGEPTIFDMAFTARHIGFHYPVAYKKTDRHWSRSTFVQRRMT